MTLPNGDRPSSNPIPHEGDRYDWARLVFSDRKLSERAKVLAQVLANYRSDKTGKAWPSHDRLAEDTGMVVRKVYRAQGDLVLAGYVRVKKRRFKGTVEFSFTMPENLQQCHPWQDCPETLENPETLQPCHPWQSNSATSVSPILPPMADYIYKERYTEGYNRGLEERGSGLNVGALHPHAREGGEVHRVNVQPRGQGATLTRFWTDAENLVPAPDDESEEAVVLASAVRRALNLPVDTRHTLIVEECNRIPEHIRWRMQEWFVEGRLTLDLLAATLLRHGARQR